MACPRAASVGAFKAAVEVGWIAHHSIIMGWGRGEEVVLQGYVLQSDTVFPTGLLEVVCGIYDRIIVYLYGRDLRFGESLCHHEGEHACPRPDVQDAASPGTESP